MKISMNSRQKCGYGIGLFTDEPRDDCRFSGTGVCYVTGSCYRGTCRDKIKEVMRFSGRHLIKKGRVDLLGKFFF